MEFNFTRLDLLLSFPAEPIPALAAPDDDTIVQLSRQLLGALLKCDQQFQCDLRVARGQAMKLTWIGVGQTAGVGYWMRGGEVEAVSLLLSGVDLVEDLGALQVVTCAVPAALPQLAIDSILQTSRPLIACLYNRPSVLKDLTLCTGMSALGTAFFGMLGLGAESQRESCE